MIDITIEEAMKCLQIFQEQQPENGYAFNCFNLALSALKTIEDMQLNGNYTPSPLQNISREIIAKLAEFKCQDPYCKNCICNHRGEYNDICASSCAITFLSDYTAIKYVYEWLQLHPDIVAQWKEEIERSENIE